MDLSIKIIILGFALMLANLPYKKEKTFANVSWGRALFLSALFLFSSALLIYICYPDAVVSYNIGYVIVLTLTLIFWLLTPLIVRRYGDYPKAYIERPGNESRFMARLEYKSMTVKLFEVILQEVGFLYIYFSILKGLTFYEKEVAFVVIVVAIHLANLLFMNAWWALFYTLLSVPMAIVFGIMMSRGQFFLTMSIHLVFYILFNIRYWFSRKLRIIPHPQTK